MRTSTIFDDLIKTVESSDSEEISRVNETWVEFEDNALCVFWSFFPLVAGGIMDEVNVEVNHPERRVGSEDGDVGVGGEAAEEKESAHEDVWEIVVEMVAESEDHNTGVGDFLELLGGEVRESGFVFAVEED
jgi:hypothetical protein